MSIENFYGLEGLDGVGKTTVGETLKDRGYMVLKTPPESFPIKRESYDKLNISSRFLFYLMGVIMAGKKAKSEARNQPVICDRYLLTTVSAHEALGLSRLALSILIPVLKTIPVPQNTFLLVASDEELAKRLSKRGANEVDLANLKINDKILVGYRGWSEKLNHRLTEIDTTNMTPILVAENIEDLAHSK